MTNGIASPDRLLPHGWKTSRVKYLARYINGYAFKPEDWSDTGKPILRIQNLSETQPAFNRFEGELPDQYIVRHDDVLISWSGSLGVYKWTGEEAWLNQHIFKVDIIESIVLRDYFIWLATWFIGELDSKLHGSTMQHLTSDAFGNFKVPLPPFPIQHAIAQYLECETDKLDAMIDAKERLLKLLNEKRRALITHAVTRGLNPDAVMHDSYVEWLGEIPVHWTTEYTKWLFCEIDERSVAGEEELLSVSHITGVTSRSEKDVNMFMAESMEGYKICRTGDLVINTLWGWMGAMGVAFRDGIVSPAYHVYRPTNRIDPQFIDYLVRIPVFAQEVMRYSSGVWSSRLRIYPEEFFKIMLPVPPLEEQKEIASYLAAKTAKLDELYKTTELSIDLLRERRSALIAEAVLGKTPTLE